MKRRTGLAIVVVASVALLTLGCASTPDSRIEQNQALFDTYPVEVQSNIRLGKVALGYDEAMVRMAMSDPDETSTEVNDSGETVMWGYTRSRPGISVGVGGGSYGGRTGTRGGVAMGSGPKREYVAIVEFRTGKVTSVRHFDN